MEGRGGRGGGREREGERREKESFTVSMLTETLLSLTLFTMSALSPITNDTPTLSPMRHNDSHCKPDTPPPAHLQLALHLNIGCLHLVQLLAQGDNGGLLLKDILFQQTEGRLGGEGR